MSLFKSYIDYPLRQLMNYIFTFAKDTLTFKNIEKLQQLAPSRLTNNVYFERSVLTETEFLTA